MWWCIVALSCLHLEAAFLVDAYPLTAADMWDIRPPGSPPVHVPQHTVSAPATASDMLHYRLHQLRLFDTPTPDEEKADTDTVPYEEHATKTISDFGNSHTNLPLHHHLNPNFDTTNPNDLDDSTDPVAAPFDLYLNRATKRAFTLLSRWHPFSTLGRDPPSIREQNRQIFNDLDIETRAMLRPVGQPLRWG